MMIPIVTQRIFIGATAALLLMCMEGAGGSGIANAEMHTRDAIQADCSTGSRINSNDVSASDDTDPDGLLPPGYTSTARAPTVRGDAFGGPVSSVEVRLDREANDQPYTDVLRASLFSGDSIGYALARRLQREVASPAKDEQFDQERFIACHRAEIAYDWTADFMLADSEAEANALMRDMIETLASRELIDRRLGIHQP